MIIFDCERNSVKTALHIHSTGLLPLKALWKEFIQAVGTCGYSSGVPEIMRIEDGVH